MLSLSSPGPEMSMLQGEIIDLYLLDCLFPAVHGNGGIIDLYPLDCVFPTVQGNGEIIDLYPVDFLFPTVHGNGEIIDLYLRLCIPNCTWLW